MKNVANVIGETSSFIVHRILNWFALYIPYSIKKLS